MFTDYWHFLLHLFDFPKARLGDRRLPIAGVMLNTAGSDRVRRWRHGEAIRRLKDVGKWLWHWSKNVYVLCTQFASSLWLLKMAQGRKARWGRLGRRLGRQGQVKAHNPAADAGRTAAHGAGRRSGRSGRRCRCCHWGGDSAMGDVIVEAPPVNIKSWQSH